MVPGSQAPTACRRHRRAADVLLLAMGVAACLVPYLGRLRHPSLYNDDVVRIVQLRTTPLPRLLFLNFNEHMAPLFQGVSWLTWQSAGGRLSRAPLAFTLASYVPFVLSLGLLGRLLRGETGSTPAALSGMALFSQCWLAGETVYWYSASSFMWALMFTLIAWLGACWTFEGETRRGLWALGLGSALAPASSAIGLLAGPLALLRLLAAGDRGGEGRRMPPRVLLAPVVGTLAYLSVGWAARYGDVLADSLGRNVHLRAGLVAALRTPVDHLLPALVDLKPIGAHLGTAANLAFLAAALLVTLAWAFRSESRPMILGGLALILGGYALALCARVDPIAGTVHVAQRYHLFPQLGLVFVLAPAIGGALKRWAPGPVSGLAAVTTLAAVLGALHAPELRGWGRFYRYPEQVETLAAIDRLGVVCEASRWSRAGVLAAIDPIQCRWSPPGFNALELLADPADVPRRPGSRAREAILAALSPREREAICGGMDATPYLRPIDEPGDLEPAAVGRLESVFRVRATGTGTGRWVAAGWPSFLEYEVPDGDGLGHGAIRALGLPLEMDEPGAWVEVWWRGDRDPWSESRSVRCRPGPSRDGRGWAIPTDRLPHWDPGGSRHFRLLFRSPGSVAVAAPRLLR